jgi:hypothetical protein
MIFQLETFNILHLLSSDKFGRKNILLKLTVLSSVVVLSLLIVQLLAAFYPAMKVNAAISVDILSYKGGLTPDNFYRVIGEVKNTGDQSVENITLKVSLYDSNHQTIKVLEEPTEVQVLLPERKSPFSIYFNNQTLAPLVSTCEASIIHYDESAGKPTGLEIVWHGFDNTSIYGQIRNPESSTANSVAVWATFYDTNLQVVDVSYDGGIAFLTSHSDEQFEIMFPSLDIFERAKYYSLTAESTEYAVEKETTLMQLSPEENFDIFYFFAILVGVSAIIILVSILIARIRSKKNPRRRR